MTNTLTYEIVSILLAVSTPIEPIELQEAKLIAEYVKTSSWHDYDIKIYRINSSYIIHQYEEHFCGEEEIIDKWYIIKK